MRAKKTAAERAAELGLRDRKIHIKKKGCEPKLTPSSQDTPAIRMMVTIGREYGVSANEGGWNEIYQECRLAYLKAFFQSQNVA